MAAVGRPRTVTADMVREGVVVIDVGTNRTDDGLVGDVDFGKAFATRGSFLKTAQTFEDLGVSAYNGAAPQTKSKDVLGAAGSIAQVEARHAAAIRFLRGKPITDGAFDKALEMPAVLEAAKPFIKM